VGERDDDRTGNPSGPSGHLLLPVKCLDLQQCRNPVQVTGKQGPRSRSRDCDVMDKGFISRCFPPRGPPDLSLRPMGRALSGTRAVSRLADAYSSSLARNVLLPQLHAYFILHSCMYRLSLAIEPVREISTMPWRTSLWLSSFQQPLSEESFPGKLNILHLTGSRRWGLHSPTIPMPQESG
jgi:hypothetical protein